MEPARILLVEDNYGDIVLIREIFSQSRITNPLEIAEDGEVAMEMLNRTGQYAGYTLPDLILLDLNLPRKDGKEVLAEIKSNSLLQNIPVVVLTSSKIEMDMVMSYGFPASNYVIKPVNLSNLCQMLETIDTLGITLVRHPATDREKEKAYAAKPLNS